MKMLCVILGLFSLSGCAITNHDLERWKAQTDNILATTNAAIDKAKDIANEAKNRSDMAVAKVEQSFDKLEAMGAPTDNAADLGKWIAQNPLEAAGSTSTIAIVMASLLLGYRRMKKVAKVPIKAIEDYVTAHPESDIKSFVANNGGLDPTIRDLIRKLKG